MSQEMILLMGTAAFIGFFHTLLGPDHYLPFVVLGKARNWSIAKVSWVTLLCGIGHVASSVVLGLAGIALGITVTKLTAVESFRGNLAAWALTAFGLVYFIWGLRRARQQRPHEHLHVHSDGRTHIHRHVHTEEHSHFHEGGKTGSLTPWVLFIIFVLGPCEPLIPILLYPAAKENLWGVLLVAAVFSAATLLTMLAVVISSFWGLNRLPLQKMERFTHAAAGGSICLCGAAIQFLGL